MEMEQLSFFGVHGERRTYAPHSTQPQPQPPGRQVPGPHPPVRHDHPETSHAAAEAIAPRTPTVRAVVYQYIAAHGPCTDDELISHFAPRYSPSTIRPRRIELAQAGLVRDSGQRGRTSAGRAAILWEAMEER